jgi:uncharacterized protein
VAQNPDRASYFPAIEKKHGQPMAYWFGVMKEISDRKYDEQMAFLQEEHGFSRAHANALILYSRGSTSSKRYDTVDAYLATLDDTKRATVERIIGVISGEFPEVEWVIAWNTPMAKVGKSYLFGVSSAKNHLMIAPWDSDVLEEMRPRLEGFVLNKKTIRIPVDWDVDAELITDMVSGSLARTS